MQTYEHATVKFNNGQGALLCHACSKIIKTGFSHEDKRHYCCDDCSTFGDLTDMLVDEHLSPLAGLTGADQIGNETGE